MNYFEVKPDGQAYIRTDSGTVIRKVGNGEAVNHAEFNKRETLFVIVYDSGRCEVRDRKNKLVRTLADDGITTAYMNLDKILLIKNDGTKETVEL